MPDISDQQHIDMFKEEDAFEAILKRPDRDIGSIESLPSDIWLVSREVMEYFDAPPPGAADARKEADRIKKEAKKAAAAAAAATEAAAASAVDTGAAAMQIDGEGEEDDKLLGVLAAAAAAATAAAVPSPKVPSRPATPGTPAKRAKVQLPVCKMSEERHSVVYGLYKTVEEVMVNAGDQKYSDKANELPLTYLEYNIDRHTGQFGVKSNGKAIPVVEGKDKVFIPTMVFSKLLSGSNGADTGKRFKGGRNGLGAKLCNLFSRWFTVRIRDTARGLHFEQTWRNNIKETTGPKITPFTASELKKLDGLKAAQEKQKKQLADKVVMTAKEKEPVDLGDYVHVTWMPDYNRFGRGRVAGTCAAPGLRCARSRLARPSSLPLSPPPKGGN